MTYLYALWGPALVGALCLVIFVEECGVPLPFAPGDLILVACGLAIRNGHVNPVLAIAAVYVATVGGAMTGRELFALAGSRLLRWLAARGRLQAPLERASRLLRRGGWPAVLLARLTPGLRISTTQVAGLLELPRRTFLAGLAPATAVYMAVFVGAGALVGRPAVGLLLRASHRFGLGVVLLTGIALWVGGIWLVARVLSGGKPGSEGGRA